MSENKKNNTFKARKTALPFRRNGFTQKSKIAGHNLYLTTGEYDNGKLGEIFLDMHKQGSTFRAFMNCFAVSISIGLQHGIPLSTYFKAFKDVKFFPNGKVEGSDKVNSCSSIIDYIFKELSHYYTN